MMHGTLLQVGTFTGREDFQGGLGAMFQQRFFD
jgi:hypothetical protein